MSSSSLDQSRMREMIMSFRVSELQLLLGFAGRNKNGKKHELQARALELVRIRSQPMQAKIRELYKASQEAQQQQIAMMQPNGAGGQYPGIPGGNQYASNLSAAAAMMGLNSAYGSAAANAALQGRNPYTTGSASGYAAGHFAAAAAASGGLHPAASQPPNSFQMAAQQQQQQRASMHTMQQQIYADTKFVKLPFYDNNAELLRPTSLVSQGNTRFQEANYQFFLNPSQATEIASNRDISVGSQCDYLYQLQLRFCQLSMDGKEGKDEFPPSVCVHVNGKMAPLPNPIPTNKPGQEPKRPPRPTNITSLCKLSPILPNNVNIKWGAEYGKGWVAGIWLVMKLTSKDLLERLKKKGTRSPEFTRSLIKDKLNDDDEVATTSLKVTVSCPLGKMRMTVPCRPSTCNHLQCFDAMLFLQMNERKPTWNCPVCDSKALYDTLMIDGYFMDVLESPLLPKEENEIILENDGSWKPVPKDEDKTKPPSSLPPPSSSEGNGTSASANVQNGTSEKKAEDVECIDLSDDEDGAAPPSSAPPLPSGPPPPPPPGAPYPGMAAAGLPPPGLPPPPMPPAEIEIIDLD